MKNTIVALLIAFSAFACSSAPEPTESLASVEQAICWGPTGSQAAGLTASPVSVQRAHFLVNKMWGAWPKLPPTCPGASYCGTWVPNTCTQGQCDAGQCFGWTCRMTEVHYAADGLRLSTVVADPSWLETRWALQPMAGGLDATETTELGVVRAAATLVTDFWCTP